MLEQVKTALKRFDDVSGFYRLGGIVADPSGSSQKNHGGGNFFRQNHGIMSGAAHHAVRFTPGFSDRLFNFIDQKRAHRHRLLIQESIPAQV